MEMSKALKTRIDALHQCFVFAGYKWTFQKQVESKDHTKMVVYRCVPLKKHPDVDILTVFKDRFNSYRVHLETEMSLLYDYTIYDIEVILTDSDEFRVSLVYANGTELFNSVRRAYKRLTGPAAYPILETNDNYNGSVFPLQHISQFSNGFTFAKGYIQALFQLSKNGELISDHYNQDSLDHGIPILTLMLTLDEYKEFNPNTKKYMGYDMITDLPALASKLGADNEDMGLILLWLGYLIDIQHSIEEWTFNQAYDERDCRITTVKRYNLPEMYLPGDNSTIITVESAVCGIMSEGVEAVLVLDPEDADPTKSECKANFRVTFCNGIENDRVHTENASRISNIVFDNLYNDMQSFGWKLGKPYGDPYVGLLCVSDDILYKESVDPNYVRSVNYEIKYHPYFFCPDKSYAKRLAFKNKCTKLFGNKFTKDMIVYPVKLGNSIGVYKSYAKDPLTKKFKYVAIVSLKDFMANGLHDLANALEEAFGIGGRDGITFKNPMNDGLFNDLIYEFIKPYLDITDRDVCATFIGKKLMVLEKISTDQVKPTPKTRE